MVDQDVCTRLRSLNVGVRHKRTMERTAHSVDTLSTQCAPRYYVRSSRTTHTAFTQCARLGTCLVWSLAWSRVHGLVPMGGLRERGGRHLNRTAVLIQTHWR